MNRKALLALGMIVTAICLTASSAFALDSVSIQYKCAQPNQTTNTIYPWFKVVNNGSTYLDLSRVTIRYWFTRDTGSSQVAVCNWAQVGAENVFGLFNPVSKPATNADYYLEIGFTEGAGGINSGASSGEIQMRFYKDGWTDYIQSNDYSFNAAMTSYTANAKVTAYIDHQLVCGTEPDTNAIRNANFINASNGIPRDWEQDTTNNPTAQLTWVASGGIKNSACLKISAISPGECSWKQTLNLTPGATYTVKGFIKGENVSTEGDEGANISILDTWDGTWLHNETLGTFDWKEVAFTFQAPASGVVVLACRLGYGTWYNMAKGTVWFDNLTIYRLERSERPHIYLDLEGDDRAVITPQNLNRWLDHLEATYLALVDLVGTAPFDGARIGIITTQQFPGGGAVAGNPIRWSKWYESRGPLISCNDNDDWLWGIIHELGHDFDWEQWDFNSEYFASFKAAYVIDVLNGKIPYTKNDQVIWYVGPQIEQQYYADIENNYCDSIARGIYRDTALIYCWFRIKDAVGWAPFKETFRYFIRSGEIPATPLEKFNRFMDKLTEYAHSDVRATFKPGELATIVNGIMSPTNPENLTAAIQGQGITLSWSPSTDNVAVAHYRVYRRTGNEECIIASPQSTNFTDSGVQAGKTYTYWISAVDTADAESCGSEAVTVTLP